MKEYKLLLKWITHPTDTLTPINPIIVYRENFYEITYNNYEYIQIINENHQYY